MTTFMKAADSTFTLDYSEAASAAEAAFNQYAERW